MPREAFERQFCATGAPKDLLKASLCYGKPAVGPTPDLAQNGPVATEICLAEGKPEARGQTPAGLPGYARAGLKAILCYERAVKGKPVLREGC